MRPEHWKQLTRHAAGQHGLVTSAQIQATGAARQSVGRAVTKGLLVPFRRSVYLVAGSPASVWQPLMAAYLVCPPDAVVSHRSAAGLHGLPGVLPGAVEITTPARPVELAGVVGHATGRLDDVDVVVLAGFRATSPARTILDVAGTVHPSLLSSMVADALRRRLCSEAALERQLASYGGPGRPGAAALRSLLRDHVGGDSPLESSWLRVLRAAGLRPPALQHQLAVGHRVLVLDFAWPAERVGVEVDGWSIHRQRAVWDRDHDKANAYAEAGWTVLFVTSRTSRADVCRQLRRFLSGSRAMGWRAIPS